MTTTTATTGTWLCWTGRGWADVPAGTPVTTTTWGDDALHEIQLTADTCADVPALIGEWVEARPGATGGVR